METYRTSAQWQQLLLKCSTFSGLYLNSANTIISLLRLTINNVLYWQKTKPNSTFQCTRGALHHRACPGKTNSEVCAQTRQNTLQFEYANQPTARSYRLATADIVAIIKGLTV